ncbi:MAG: B12-binding domain-containing radical SAM protein [Candidatus Riflebacteria bacterium]|nr:B12-binding domain-containing radical SAM protein [Candidatus Riflebacteria bacterium]
MVLFENIIVWQMKILILDPTCYSDGKLFKVRKIGYFPLTLPRIAACFPSGHEILLCHERAQEVDFSQKYDLVFFSTMGSNWIRAEELSRKFLQSGAKTVAGGYSVPQFSERMKDAFSSLVTGDAENLIPQILNDFQNNSLKKMYENLFPDISSLPLPRFDLVPASIIGDVLPVEASRGCPNKCEFCSISKLYSGKFRKRDVVEVIRDIDSVVSLFKKRFIYFTDANFTADMNHAKNILQKLKSRNIFWIAGADINCLKDDEFLILAAESGCLSLQIGFETLSAKNLHFVGKGFAAGVNYSEAIKNAHKFGVPVTALMMVGFDHDDKSTFKAIKSFVENNHISMLVTHPVIPVPGTKLYEQLKEQGRLLDCPPEMADGKHVIFRPVNFSAEELERRYWQLNQRVFGMKSILKRFFWSGVLRNIPSYAVLFVLNLIASRTSKKQLTIGDYKT